MFNDCRYAVRSLFRTKGFTLVTMLTLALGIGSAGAIFSVVDWVLFRSVDFPKDVVFVGARDKQGQFSPWQIDAQAQAYRGLTAVFSDFGLASYQPANIVLAGEPVLTGVVDVSSNLLPLLGAVPVLGRGFLPEEEAAGHNQVVVIAHEFWQQQFHGAEDVLGREVVVDQTVCKVIGVLPAKQTLPPYVRGGVFRPLVYQVDPAEPWSPPLFLFGRLRPGVSIPRAEQALAGVKVDLPPAVASYMAEQKPSLSTLAELQKLTRPEIYWVLLGAVGFLYGIACLNATNLMLLRMLGKRRELSIRLALGGGRWRLIRLFLIESLGLSLAASGLGVVFANWFFPLFMAAAGGRAQENWAKWSLDWRALAVLGGLTLATSLVIVVVPALRILRADISQGLKDGGAALGESRQLARLRGGFVVLQAAFAVILLIGAGLMVRTFGKLQEVDLGFDPSRRVKVQLVFPSHYVPGSAERLALLRRLQEHLRHVPGVQRVAYGTDGLMTGYYYANWSVQLADGTPVKIKTDYLSPEYLETAGMSLKRGRSLRPGAAAEILVNEAFAHARFGDADPVGQFIKAVKNDQGLVGWTVVGVVRDVRENVRAKSGYHIYGPDEWLPGLINSFIVQVAREPDAALTSALKRAVYEFDPRIMTVDVAPLDRARDRQTELERFALSVLKVLSAIALVLTFVGLFSVLAYTVDRRMGEFGIRLALGATPRHLLLLVLRRGVLLALAGIIIGLAGSVALTRYLQSMLYETPPHDPWVLGAVALLLFVAAGGACVLPATRAARADIARLLRAE